MPKEVSLEIVVKLRYSADPRHYAASGDENKLITAVQDEMGDPSVLFPFLESGDYTVEVKKADA